MFSPRYSRTCETGKQECSGTFFPAKNFFGPVVQRQPAKGQSEAEELKSLGESIKKDISEVKQSLCELSLAFFKVGYTGGTQSTINRQTPEVLDALMDYAANCGSLSQYITLRPTRLSEGHYRTYKHQRSDDFLEGASSHAAFDANEWHRAVKAYLPGSERSEIAKIGGFYNRVNDTVNLPADSTFGNALHEAVHRISGAMARGRFGHYLPECLYCASILPLSCLYPAS